MRTFTRLFMTMLAISFLAFAGSGCSSKKASSATMEPGASGTITIDETQVMVIVGGDYGHGTLMFQGKSYPFKAKGLKLGGVGIHEVKLTGDVYKLNDIKDFPGLYFAAEAGITVAKGAGGFWMKNDKGVALHLKSSAEGLALAIGVEGFDIKME